MATGNHGDVDMDPPFWKRLDFAYAKRLPLVLQTEVAECGLACLAMVATYHGHRTDLPTLRRRFSLSLKGATLTQVINMADALKFASRPLRVELEYLPELRTPCILHWNLNHFVVLKHADRSGIEIHDPVFGARVLPLSEVSKHFTGVALELTPTTAFERKEDRQSIRIRDLLGTVDGLWRSMLQILLLAFALQVFGLIGPFFMQWVVDGVLVSDDKDLLVTLALGFSLLLTIQIGLTWMRSWMVLYMSTHVAIQWNANVFTHLLRLPVSYFEKRHVGDIVSRLGSMQTIQRTLTTSFVEAILDGLMACTTFAMMLYYSTLLSAIVAVAVLAYVLVRAFFYRPLRVATEEEIVLAAKQQTHLLESVRGVQSIKLFSREDERRARYLNLAVDTTNRHIRTERLRMVYQSGNGLIFGACAIVITYFGATLALDNVFSVGMLFAFTAYSANFTTRIGSLIDKWIELRMLSLQGERLADIVLSEPEQLREVDASLDANRDDQLATDADIEFRDVSFRYSDSEPFVLQNYSVRIGSGESVAIVGPSGCGKTTLAKVMLGLLSPTAGEVLFGGISIHHIGLNRFRRMIGTVMQDDQLFAGSIADNIHFFDSLADQNFVEVCAKLSAIHSEIMAMPMGYSTLIGDMGTAISGGQKQRILLARALYKRPQVLLLDEATSHLDIANEHAVNLAITDLKITRIIIAHRPETIATAQRVIAIP